MDTLLLEVVLWAKRSKTSVSFYLFDIAIEREEDYEHVYHWQLSHCWVWTFFSRPTRKEATKWEDRHTLEEDMPF
jgi:hypothetical protein